MFPILVPPYVKNKNVEVEGGGMWWLGIIAGGGDGFLAFHLWLGMPGRQEELRGGAACAEVLA